MIKSVKLSDFRNFKKKILKFAEGITVIVGPNASGKTNVLESLFLLSMGRSFKTNSDSEAIQYEKDLTRIEGALSYMPYAISEENYKAYSIEHNTSLEMVITRGENGWPKKKMLINGVAKRLIDFAGNFKVVLFGPWDLDLVTESPSLRRKFLDTVLSQVDREYRRSVLSYEKGLRQRNRLLFRIREEGLSRGQLLFWNQLLIKNGNYISEKRREFIDFANEGGKIRLDYDSSAVSEGRLEQYKDEEIAAATTLVGPHRDDFVFFDQKRDLSKYGSRGEQRMAVLWLKLAELAFIEEKTDEKPILLLDDIFSELDHMHRDIVMKIAAKQQTIITTADPHFIEKLKVGDIIKL